MIQTEVDGVPTLVAPGPGPMRAGLVFRVGRADEVLSRGGITHLVEHLALYGHGQTDYHFNGATSSITTTFHMAGSEDDVVSFLGGVCSSLGNLPVGRMVTEKSILRTEAAGRSVGANIQLPLWRYGARGFGLVSYPEWGLDELTPDDLCSWSAHWFTRQNAALWIAGGSGVPAGLRLPLPAGARRPPPAVTSALPTTPAFFSSGSDVVVFDGVVRRSPAASVFADVLERELYRALRQDGGYSYTASAAYSARDRDFGMVTAVADSLEDTRAAVIGGFADVLAKLRVGRIEQPDIDAVKAKAVDFLDSHDAWRRVANDAMDLLVGAPVYSDAEIRERLRAVTAADVHAVAVEAMGSGLLMVPDPYDAEWAGFDRAPAGSERAVTGQSYPLIGSDKCALVASPEGVSRTHPDGVETVLFSACSAILSWPDGARQLTGHDGVTVRVEPTIYRGAAGLGAWIDSAVSPSLLVQRPARAPDSIPQPPTEGQLQAAKQRREERESSSKPMTTRAKVITAVILVALAAGAAALIATNPGRLVALVGRVICIAVVVAAVGAWQTNRGKS